MQSSVILVIPAYGEPESIGGVPQCDRFTLDTARRDRRCAMTIAAGVVYVVAKAPRPRVTKTRLCPPLTRDQAAQLASAFLLDTLVNVNLAGLTAGIVCREASERKALRQLVGPRVQVSIQSGGGPGDGTSLKGCAPSEGSECLHLDFHCG